MSYHEFVSSKKHHSGNSGFDPVVMPEFLFPFQKALVEWATLKGRCAIFADCGLGKTAMQLSWAQNVVEKTNGRVLILTPLSVAGQTQKEAQKFGFDAKVSRDGSIQSRIVVTNYHKLNLFSPSDFDGVVCDESSILKNFDGAIRHQITEFMKRLKFRLLCTATAAPNDYIELGTSSEALGELGFVDMLGRFFKKSEATMSRKDEFRSGLYRFRGHAENDFWRWVCSWARAVRFPSDIGFSNDGYNLPPLNAREHVISSSVSNPDFLFDMPAVGLAEQRAERRRTIGDRCEKAASLVNATGQPAVCWCHLNSEGDMLEKMIKDAVQVDGNDSDEFKEEAFDAFAEGKIRILISKPVVAGFGLNWQHCAHQTFFPSHSFEQYYQSVRRCWRFGQKRAVTIDIVTSEGERGVLSNMTRKAKQSEQMFGKLVENINLGRSVSAVRAGSENVEIPSWL